MDDQLLKPDEQERKEDDRLMEVVEEDVVDGEPGKGVKQPAEDGIIALLHKPLEVEGAGEGGAGVLEDEQRSHQMGDEGGGEGQGQPEKRASEQVEAVGADKVGAQVGIPVPEEIPGPHRLVGELIERDLLDVKIPVKEKVPLVPDDEREKDDGGCHQCDQKRPAAAALILRL